MDRRYLHDPRVALVRQLLEDMYHENSVCGQQERVQLHDKRYMPQPYFGSLMVYRREQIPAVWKIRFEHFQSQRDPGYKCFREIFECMTLEKMSKAVKLNLVNEDFIFDLSSWWESYELNYVQNTKVEYPMTKLKYYIDLRYPVNKENLLMELVHIRDEDEYPDIPIEVRRSMQVFAVKPEPKRKRRRKRKTCVMYAQDTVEGVILEECQEMTIEEVGYEVLTPVLHVGHVYEHLVQERNQLVKDTQTEIEPLNFQSGDLQFNHVCVYGDLPEVSLQLGDLRICAVRSKAAFWDLKQRSWHSIDWRLKKYVAREELLPRLVAYREDWWKIRGKPDVKDDLSLLQGHKFRDRIESILAEHCA